MKAFIEYVVKALVDHPDQVQVRELDGDRVVIFELRLHPEDVGKVIGKNGRTISAIRTLVTGAAGKYNKRAMVEIIEPESPGTSPATPDSAAASQQHGN